MSDHNPLLINTKGFTIMRNEKPFKFMSTWQLHEDFDAFIKTHQDDQ